MTNLFSNLNVGFPSGKCIGKNAVWSVETGGNIVKVEGGG